MSPAVSSSRADAPPVLIRDAAEVDLPAIRRLIPAAYLEYESVLSPDLFAAYIAELLTVTEPSSTAHLVVATIDGKVIGAVTFYPDADRAGLGMPADWSTLRALAVDPAHRGRGVGAALLTACTDRAMALGARNIGLHTAHFMTTAIKLYERFGFERAPQFDVNAVDIVSVDDPDGPLVIAYQRALRPPTPVDSYPLGRSAAETRRLILQHQIYGPLTRQLLIDAGITRGMKVLDLGSGAGDVAMLLADLVGPQGRVVGVDANADILDAARAHVGAAGWTNVEFVVGDLDHLDVATDFDAVVGRWILMYLAEPADLLRRLPNLTRPGAVIAFQESADLTAAVEAVPPTPLHDQLARWTTPPAEGTGPIVNMGRRLYHTFLDAGLPAPQLRLEAPIGGGPDWPGYSFIASSIRSLLPMLQQRGSVTAEIADVDTLEDRLRTEVVERDGMQILPTVIGAWTRTSAGERRAPQAG